MQPLSLLISRSDALPKSWRELIGQQDHVKGPHVYKTKNNNNKKPLVTTYWPTSGWVTEKIHYFSFSSNFAIDVFISTRESIFVISNGNDTNKETNQPTNRRTNEQIAKNKNKKKTKKKTRAKDNCKLFTRSKALHILSRQTFSDSHLRRQVFYWQRLSSFFVFRPDSVPLSHQITWMVWSSSCAAY